MLSTLFKYEFKNTAKVMLTLYGILTVVTILWFPLAPGFDGSETSIEGIQAIFTLVYFALYMMSIVACIFITIIYLTVHFYKTMYASQGYLTFTLPVKPVTIFNVKLLVSAVWMLLSITFIILSFFSILASLPGFMDELQSGYSLKHTMALYLSTIGMRSGEFIIYLVMYFILICFMSPIRLYLGCSIGQLFNNRKVSAAIIAGIVLFFAHNSIVQSFAELVELYQQETNLLFSGIAWILFIFDLFFTFLFYLGNVIIVKKHINLE